MNVEMSGNGQLLLLPRQQDYKVELTFFLLFCYTVSKFIYSQTCCDVFSSGNYQIVVAFLNNKRGESYFLKLVDNYNVISTKYQVSSNMKVKRKLEIQVVFNFI